MRKHDAILVGSLCLFLLSVASAEKLRLGDIPDENDKRTEQRKDKNAASRDPQALEDRQVMQDQMAEKSRKKKPAAPPHSPIERKPKPTPKKQVPSTVKPAPSVVPAVKKQKPVRPQPTEPAPSPAAAKDQSKTLYRRALMASQKGRYEEAYGLCGEALKLDPENLQAQRMSERLGSRFHKP